MTLVTVLRNKYAPGWPRHEQGERAYVLPIGKALERDYTSDAHFAAYRSPNGRRLTREALDHGVAVEITCVVFDVDGPAHEEMLVIHPWRRELREKIQALASDHPGCFYYETRGGARIVYAQQSPTVIRSHEDARRWKEDYAIGLTHLAQRYGIEADPACGDWQRLYRLPRATREPGGPPENWPEWGNPHAIGALWLDATNDELETAARTSKAFRQAHVTDVTPCASSGDGLFYHLLRARGDIIREHGAGTFVVRCPREHEHTTGATGDGSTLLYLPAAGKELGAIHCLHAHCTNVTPPEWFRSFSDHELDVARHAAGIRRRR